MHHYSRIRLGLTAIFSVLVFFGCEVEKEQKAVETAVLTINPNYDRTLSRVLIRRVKTPTRANLDYAGYYHNVILYDTGIVELQIPEKVGAEKMTFDGVLSDIKISPDGMGLTEAEMASPMSFSPVQDFLMNWNFEKGAEIANAYSQITDERWGDEETEVSHPFQEISVIYIHSEGNRREVWAKLEFKPWMKPFLEGIPDSDKDKFPEVYGKFNPDVFTPELIQQLQGEYSSKVLNEQDVIDWANTLAAYWYPTYNTDVINAANEESWPFDDTEEPVKKELNGVIAEHPISIFRGRPFGIPIYQVFVVDGMGMAKKKSEAAAIVTNRKLDENLEKNLTKITENIQAELKKNGSGKWEKWSKNLENFHNKVQNFSTTQAKDVMGLVGENEFLVFRRELDYLLAGDLSQQSPEKNPLPAIVDFRNKMAQKGIDFLFVPIPTKQDIYPEIIPGVEASLPGQIAQPYVRKLMLDLAEQGVETIDLVSAFLEAKKQTEEGKKLLYQHQDTHWSSNGIDIAAGLVAQRIRGYAWYTEAYPNIMEYNIVDTTFENKDDIVGRLPDNLKTQFPPKAQPARKIQRPDGSFYDDQENAPVLIMGDSYTGVFQKVGPKFAGVSAHLAKNLGGPVDLVMGWGGGPEGPDKVKRRGEEALQGKRLVVWMMTVRDLFAYEGSWAPKEEQTVNK